MRTIGMIGAGCVVVGLGFGCTSEESREGAGVATMGAELTAAQQQKLVAPDPGPGDRFGQSVAISGNTAVAGAALDDTGPRANHGSVYVFVRNGATWSLQQKLGVPGGSNEQFGEAVAVEENRMVVTAIGGDARPNGSTGLAYVFGRTGSSWTQEAVLEPTNPGPGPFGYAVALSGDTVLVGGDSTSHFFVRDSSGVWTERQAVAARANAVALSGNTALLGERLANVGSNVGQGVVRSFVRSGVTWIAGPELTASDGQPDDRFGSSVALSGDVALVGATDDGFVGTGQGSAYFFRRSGSGWIQEQKVSSSDGVLMDGFGASVALLGDLAVVGAHEHEHLGINANHGSAYVFVRAGSGWVEDREIRANDAQNNDFFGGDVAISESTILVGADNDDHPQPAQGAAYVFSLSGANGDPCGANSGCTSGFCSDGRCCNLPCEGECNACSVAAGAGVNGLCTEIPGCTEGECTPDVHCDENPCEHGGVCTDTPTGHACACPPGVNGKNCEVVFTQLSGGQYDMCGLRSDGKIACWGNQDTDVPISAPLGTFRWVSLSQHLCAVRTDGSALCQGYGATTPPPLQFKSVFAGDMRACGILENDTVTCWGQNPLGAGNAPAGTFRTLALGSAYTCGIRTDGTIACWGLEDAPPGFDVGQTAPPPGVFTDITASRLEACGIQGGNIVCWGTSSGFADTPAVLPWTMLGQGFAVGCALRSDGLQFCHESSALPGTRTSFPTGVLGRYKTFALMSIGAACAVRIDDSVICWGVETVTAPPTGSL